MDKRSKDSQVGGVHCLDIKLYTRRWFQLALFILYACTLSMHWTQFTTITNIVSRYYGVSRTLVEYTSIMCMAARAFLLFPALFLIDKLETRRTLILALALCAIGSAIKTFSVSPDGFYIAMIGQVFSALALIFTYSLIGRFSAAWFGSDEISKAGAICCVGDAVGAALGYLFPSKFVPDSQNVQEIEKGMHYMHYFYTAWDVIALTLIVIFFKSKPKRPPSAAQALSRSSESQRVYKSVLKLFKNSRFLLFVMAVGIFVGSGCNAVGTLLNEMIDRNFPDKTHHAGNLGCLSFLSGIIGAIVLSYVQDKTRMYKCNAVFVSVANCISFALFALSLKMDNLIYVYITYSIYGFLINGYYATVIQMGIELSFPIPEGITVATISVCVEIVSMIATALYGLAMKRYGDMKSNIGVVLLLCLGSIVIALVPPKFRREELERAAKSAEVKGLLYGSTEKKPVVISQASPSTEISIG